MSDNCGAASRTDDPYYHLRIASIFVILVTSLAGTLTPIIAKRSWKVPTPAFDFVKYFGSGVIIATAFVHLLSPAYEELGSACLSDTWLNYPWPAALAMASVFGIFFLELFAFRIGSDIIMKTGLAYAGSEHNVNAKPEAETENAAHHNHAHAHGHSHSHVPQRPHESSEITGQADDPRLIVAQLIGVAILEFGVILHSVIIGLTLAVNDAFRTLFVVLIFHQMFEGLGLGSRLAFLTLPPRFARLPTFAAVLYSLMTPIGISIGLGVRTTYNPDSTTASIVSGTLDSLSAGVLLYTGLVELLAHEFLFNPKMREKSLLEVAYACGCIMFGAGIMALLGRWA
ncbi:ZIP-like iron-zinc transporter [Clavulina sp. PMI_390]|nr:ZIP-like iron-zinc transporter [Clavulina sp. PMI_390]